MPSKVSMASSQLESKSASVKPPGASSPEFTPPSSFRGSSLFICFNCFSKRRAKHEWENEWCFSVFSTTHNPHSVRRIRHYANCAAWDPSRFFLIANSGSLRLFRYCKRLSLRSTYLYPWSSLIAWLNVRTVVKKGCGKHTLFLLDLPSVRGKGDWTSTHFSRLFSFQVYPFVFGIVWRGITDRLTWNIHLGEELPICFSSKTTINRLFSLFPVFLSRNSFISWLTRTSLRPPCCRKGKERYGSCNLGIRNFDFLHWNLGRLLSFPSISLTGPLFFSVTGP